MKPNQLEVIKSEINDSIDHGDFVILSKVLETKRETVQTRYRRSKEVEVLTMQKIVKGKEKLINQLKRSLIK